MVQEPTVRPLKIQKAPTDLGPSLRIVRVAVEETQVGPDAASELPAPSAVTSAGVLAMAVTPILARLAPPTVVEMAPKLGRP